MFYIKLSELLKYSGIVGLGMIVGALVSGTIIQLPMLIEAKWEGEIREIRFDSRALNICQVDEIATEHIDANEPLEQ
ncbi:MAG: hypothetical protein AAFV90_26430 [Cyanobacteria bacterium J06634_5]